MDDLTRRVKDLARANRMDLVGVASLDRYAHAPPMARPQAHLPEARAVISMAIRYPQAMYENAGWGDAESMMSMEVYQNRVIGLCLYQAAMAVTRMLENAGHQTIPMCVSGRWRIHPYKSNPSSWMADFSNRHAAVAAGLGEFGLHSLAITPQYGLRQRFISVITEAPLDADPMYDGPPLCDRCMACVEQCPVGAFDARASSLETVIIGGRTFEYAKVDHWRCAWSEQLSMIPEEGPQYFGQTVAMRPPADGDIDDKMILSAFYERCRRAGLQSKWSHTMGNCMRVCVPPHLRAVQKPPPPIRKFAEVE